MMSAPLMLNPALDPDALHARYSERGRMQVRDVFTESSAERILAMLERETPWGLVFNDGERVVELSAAQLATLTPDDQRHILNGVHEGARRGYQFLYNYYPLLTEYFRPDAPRLPLFEVFEHMNSPAMIAFLRKVTGIESIRWADGQATLFRSGQFLKYHTDETPSQKRLVAYVLNLTKNWGRDWGGYLQFFDANYDVEQAYRPVFNALNLFTIPADHSVQMVSTYVANNRFSITGWLRGDDPPGPIGGVR